MRVILLARDAARVVGQPCGPLPVRRQPLFESGDPYLEADEVLGNLRRRAQLHQLLYACRVTASLGFGYLLRASGGYGVEIVHSSIPSDRPSPYYPLPRRRA